MQTASDIMGVLQRWAEEKRPIDAHEFLDAATKLTLLLGDESDKLFNLEQNCAIERVKLLDEGKSVSDARTRVEAYDAFREARSKKALIERITETIRLAKLRARMGQEEYKAQ